MKKSVIFLIAVIYVLSIVFVGYQVQFRLARPIVYVDTITCINDDLTVYSYSDAIASGWVSDGYDYDGVIRIGYDTPVTYDYVFELKFDATPDNANNRSLSFNYDNTLTYVSVNQNSDLSCEITFKKGGQFALLVTANDQNGGASLNLFIDAKRKINL